MSYSSITEVIAGMDSLIASAKTNQQKMGYFAALYKKTTVAVAEGIKGEFFEDGPRMGKMDTVFAQRYFDAWQQYSSKQNCTQSWHFTFDACNDSSLTVIQHLMLGMNTHINLDLAIAASTIAPGEKIYSLEKDFNHINDVIAGLVDDIQTALTKIWWPMKWINQITNKEQQDVLNFSITKARQASWMNAVMLANMPQEQQAAYIAQIDDTVKLLCTKIQSPGLWSNVILQTIRMTEYNNVAKNIELIDTTIM